MKHIYTYFSIISIVLLYSCAEGDKQVENTSSTGGPNVVIDSTGLKNTSNNNTVPLGVNQPVNQTLVTPQTPQQQTVSASQNIQVTPQQVQQQIQQKMQQVVQQPQVTQQQVQPSVQQSAHPQFSAEEFKKMQDDAKKRGVNLNPAHGQPGHRCDIYVGQPLDAKPVAGLAPAAQPTTVSTNQTPQTVVAAPQPVKTEPGMNPPHGQPGHRCDIEVGKPLNSKPSPTTPSVVTAADSAKGGK